MHGTPPILIVVGLGLFAIGTIVGSFVNVCVYRLPWQKSVVWPGSHCPKCYRAVAPRDNMAAPVCGDRPASAAGQPVQVLAGGGLEDGTGEPGPRPAPDGQAWHGRLPAS